VQHCIEHVSQLIDGVHAWLLPLLGAHIANEGGFPVLELAFVGLNLLLKFEILVFQKRLLGLRHQEGFLLLPLSINFVNLLLQIFASLRDLLLPD